MKLPRLDLACADDELRPVMNHVYINKDSVVASDAHILIEHPRSLMEDIKDLPEECYIKRDAFIELTKEFIKAWFVESESIILLLDKKLKKRVVDVVTGEAMRNVGTYPNYKAVFPEKIEDVSQVGIDVTKLATLHKAMVATPKDSNGVKLQFTGVNRAILASCSGFEGRALIMPVMIQ